MAEKEVDFKQIISHCKEYGFVFQSSEIYDGLSAVYDYGPNGSTLKNNLKEYWWKSMVQLHNNIVGIDSAIFMHPKTWKASGHTDGFNDPLIDNKDSKKRYRADVLVEEYQDKVRAKVEKEVKKAAKRFGDSFEEATFLQTNPRVLKYLAEIESSSQRLKIGLETGDLASIKTLIEELGIACPVSGSKNWTDVKQFNLMYSTQMHSSGGEGDDNLYLRPETAQGIFVNFENVLRTMRAKLPFGIANIGKSFRNEITPGQFIFRTRKFEQMEIEFCCKEEDAAEWKQYWTDKRLDWYINLGLRKDFLRLRPHEPDELAHYAKSTTDIEYLYPWGWGELEGIADRGNYDLMAHQEKSGKDLTYFESKDNNYKKK